MAGTTASSIVSLTLGSSTPSGVQWCAIATDAGRHIDVNNVNATKMILLITGDSTDQANDGYYIGNTDTDASSTSPYSAGKQNQMKIFCAKVTKATAYAKLRATGATHLKHLYVAGPFEINRFKDTDGYINVSKVKLGSTTSFIAPILLP